MPNNKEYQKEWRENNKEKLKEYRQTPLGMIQENKKEYRKTPQGTKVHRITNWKLSGVICDDWDELYEIYINTLNCDLCEVELIHGMFGANKRCLDHCHISGEVRNILCNTCNGRRGILDKKVN